MLSPQKRSTILALYRESVQTYQRIFEALLLEADPITCDNIFALEDALIEEETRIAAELALNLHNIEPFIRDSYPFVHQTGATCMSTSLANAMIALQEPFFLELTNSRLHSFTNHIVENTSSFGKPFEYRSVDDMHKYLKRNDQLGFGASESTPGIERRYRCELTNSLLDIIHGLHLGKARCVVQQHAHAQLAYEVHIESKDPNSIFIRQRDPFTRFGSDQHNLIPLLEWRARYLWSPLKKIPTTMGQGFEQLSAAEALEHLARYESMDNLGVECISAILIPLENLA